MFKKIKSFLTKSFSPSDGEEKFENMEIITLIGSCEASAIYSSFIKSFVKNNVTVYGKKRGERIYEIIGFDTLKRGSLRKNFTEFYLPDDPKPLYHSIKLAKSLSNELLVYSDDRRVRALIADIERS